MHQVRDESLLIIAAGSVAVVAAVVALNWTLQRRLMYFPIGDVPTPGEIGLSDVEPVTFETTDGLGLNGWFVAASGPLSRVTVLVFNGMPAIERTGRPWRRRSSTTDYRCFSSTIGAMATIPEPRPSTGSPPTAAPPRRTWLAQRRSQ